MNQAVLIACAKQLRPMAAAFSPRSPSREDTHIKTTKEQHNTKWHQIEKETTLIISSWVVVVRPAGTQVPMSPIGE